MCLPCCNPFEEYPVTTMNFINKTLGNIKDSHTDICFIGLLNRKNQDVKLVHYLSDDKIFADINIERGPEQEADPQQDYLFKRKQEKEKK